MELPTAYYLLEQGIEQGLHTGAQLYVSRDGQPRADFALGHSTAQSAMTCETVNLWLSSTKPITAVAFAQQWEQGRVDLETPVAQLIPNFACHGKEAITWQHVLTHTAGIRSARFTYPRDDGDAILQAICNARIEPGWVPGEKAGYHIDTTWFLLAHAVEQLSGQPFSQYVQQAIFEPLEMDDCWVGMTPQAYAVYQAQDRLGVMMDTSSDPPQLTAMHEEAWVTRCRPGGNGYGPIRQLGRFYEAILAGGRLGLSRVLQPETLALFTRRHRVGLYDHTFNHTMDWGLGFICNSKQYGIATVPYGYGPYAGDHAFGHSGNQSSTAFADPEHQLVVAAFWNGMPGQIPHHERKRKLLAAIYEDLGLADTTSHNTRSKAST